MLGSPDTLARACACGGNTLLPAAAASPAAATAALGQPRPPWPPTNSDQGSLAALWGLPLAASRHRGVWATWLPLPRLLLRSNWHSSRRSEAATERAMSGSHSRADAPAGSQASNARLHTAVSGHQNIGSVAFAPVFATSDALRHDSPPRPVTLLSPPVLSGPRLASTSSSPSGASTWHPGRPWRFKSWRALVPTRRKVRPIAFCSFPCGSPGPGSCLARRDCHVVWLFSLRRGLAPDRLCAPRLLFVGSSASAQQRRHAGLLPLRLREGLHHHRVWGDTHPAAHDQDGEGRRSVFLHFHWRCGARRASRLRGIGC